MVQKLLFLLSKVSESTDKYKKRKDIHNYTISNISCYMTKTEDWTALEPFFKMWLKVHDMKLLWFCGAKWFHIVGQPSAPSIFRFCLLSRLRLCPHWTLAAPPCPQPREAPAARTCLLQAPRLRGTAQYFSSSDWLTSLGVMSLGSATLSRVSELPSLSQLYNISSCV